MSYTVLLFTDPDGRTRAPRTDSERRMADAQAEAIRATEHGCPRCGRSVKMNLAITGWVQCEQFGDGHFRKDPSAPRCEWQGFLPARRRAA